MTNKMTTPQSPTPNQTKGEADETRYVIICDFGSEGWHFYKDQTFETIDEAVRHAVGLNRCVPFVIVNIVWKPA